MEKRIYLASPTMHGEEQELVKATFDSNWIAPLGPNVDAFEQEMCAYTGAPYAAALSAGTAALHLSMKLLGIGEGDVVICQSLTFSASCNPAAYEKAKLVFVDSEEDTWNMSPAALEKALKKYPEAKAVICVHLYGTPSKLDEICALCRQYHVPLVEDAAESLGSIYKGKYTGTFGDFGIYSFNGNKIITTSGGGMLVSSDKEAIDRSRFLATQARDQARFYLHSTVGYNYRMSNILAAVGRGQLKHIEEHKQKKNWIYDTYKNAFADIEDISMNPMNPDGAANNWLSCMTIAPDSKVTPDMVMDALAEHNIESRPIWNPMQLQPVFADCDFITEDEKDTKEDCVSARIFKHGLCLPSDIKNTQEDMDKIIGIIRGLWLHV